MKKHVIDGASITDWESFHDAFAREFDFPEYYGRNMDAWNDCMSDLDELVSLQINNAGVLKERSPEIYETLVECTAFVNWRSAHAGCETIIALSYYV